MRRNCLPLIAILLAACGSSSSTSDDDGDRDADEGLTPDARRADDGGLITADASEIVGDAAVDATPPPATVIDPTGVVNVDTQIAVYQIFCRASDCLLSDNFPRILENGATSTSALAFPPGLTNVYAKGFAHHGDDLYMPFELNSVNQVVVHRLRGGVWTQIGAALPDFNAAAPLAADGQRLYSTDPAGVQSVAIDASAQTPWALLGSGLPGGTATVQVDRAGRVLAVSQREVYALAPGQTTWSKIPGFWAFADLARPLGAGLTVAWNGDVWLTGGTVAARLPAGSNTWQQITFPGSPPSNVVVDGSNTAYFTVGVPAKLYKVPAGATVAIDTGVTVSQGNQCYASDMDATGHLLFGCWYDGVGGTGAGQGTFRTTP